jgi:hypothetical protein
MVAAGHAVGVHPGHATVSASAALLMDWMPMTRQPTGPRANSKCTT